MSHPRPQTPPPEPKPLKAARSHAGLALFWAALVAELLALSLLNRYADFSVPGNASHFVPIALVAGIAYFAALAGFGKTGAAVRSPTLWGASIALRLVVLFMAPCDDLWRYLWEGNVQLHGFNPYLLSPDAPALAPLRETWWATINHRDYAAIYPPGIEWIFAQIVWTAHAARLAPALLPYVFKLVFALADLGTVALLLKLNTGSSRYRATAWYAWNPAVVIAFAGAGHYDSLLLLPLTASALLLHRANPLGACKPSWGWSLLSAVFLGIAISMKTVPLLLLPVWAFALGGRAGVLAAALAIPWGWSQLYGGLETVSRPFLAFMRVARFNDLVWWVTERLVWANKAQQNGVYTDLLLVVALGLAWHFRKDWRRGALWVMGAALILSPVLHPWYVCWILPFACWRKSPEWALFSLASLLALLAWDQTVFGAPWTEPSFSMRAMMITPPVALFIARRIKLKRLQQLSK